MSDASIHPQLIEAREFAEKLREISRNAPDKVSLAAYVDGVPEIELLANRPMRLRSVSKTAIGLAYAREVASNPAFASKTIPLDVLQRLDTGVYDGGAHAAWQAALSLGTTEVSHETIARGMLQDSSNICTQHMLDALGVEKVNAAVAEHGIAWQEFGHGFDEVANPLRGTASDTARLMHGIATKETAKVQSILSSVAMPFSVESVEHGGAQGFGKGGSAIIPKRGGGYSHDFNYAWQVVHEGKPVNIALMTNNLDDFTKLYLDKRFGAFACESSCNAGFRAECSAMFRAGAAIFAHGGELLAKAAQLVR